MILLFLGDRDDDQTTHTGAPMQAICRRRGGAKVRRTHEGWGGIASSGVTAPVPADPHPHLSPPGGVDTVPGTHYL
jgi:hypothetical protein